MGRAREIWALSALIMTPTVRLASASASADLPLAVGPAMRARGGRALLIATLIAAGRLDDRMLAAALDRLDDARFLGWIDKGDAADVAVGDTRAARAAFERWEGVDVVVQPGRHRRKRLLVADQASQIFCPG